MKITLWALIVVFSWPADKVDIYNTFEHRETCEEIAKRLEGEFAMHKTGPKPKLIECKQSISYVRVPSCIDENEI